jgi:hypothetical protein
MSSNNRNGKVFLTKLTSLEKIKASNTSIEQQVLTMLTENNNSQYEYQYSIMDDKVVTEAEAAPRGKNGERIAPHEDKGTKRQIGGAAVAGGLAGLMLVGPVGCVVVAGGAAMCATTRGNAGNVARSSGDMMANAGDRLKRLDQKHHVVNKTSRGITKGCNWVSHKLQPKARPETRLTT